MVNAAASELQWLRLLIDATQVLVVAVDARGQILRFNRAFEEATGVPRDPGERPIWELPVPGPERAALKARFSPLREDDIASSFVLHLARALTPSVRTVEWTPEVVHDGGQSPVVVLTGIDRPEQLAADRRADETDEARATQRRSERGMQRLLEENVIGIVFWDSSGRIIDANDAFLRLIEFSREELLSGTMSWRDLTPAEYRPLDDRALAEIEATGHCKPFAKEYTSKSGQRVPVLVGGTSFGDSDQPTHEGVAFILDLREEVRLRTARDALLVEEQRARIETELANARLMLLVEGSQRLARTLRVDDTLATLAELLVPALADWSYVAHRGWEGRGPWLVASAHGDPNKRALLQRLRACMPDPDAPDGAPLVFRTGEVALYESITTEQLAPTPPRWGIVGTRDAEHLRLIRELGMKSLLCVPIRGRVGIDAVVMLVAASDPHRYDRDDVMLAQDLANRAGIALENGRLLAEALEAIEARDTFLSVAAHELRTPLTSMLLRLEMLERTSKRGDLAHEAVQREIEGTEAQAYRLATLVDRLLDVGRLTTGPIVISAEEMDLAQVVLDMVASMAQDAERSGCAVDVAVPEKVMGRWDRTRMEQVLRNLLSNAMKFGSGRPIEVKVEATAESVRISVRDHGVGLSPEDQLRIFGRFERAVSTRHFGGLGLGLYISAQIVRAHNGSLRVESEPGQGACFIADLPRRCEEFDAPDVSHDPEVGCQAPVGDP